MSNFDLTPHKPQTRLMLWSDTILDLQEDILSLGITDPLYIIGGAVRDAFLHFPVKDLDLATPKNSIKIARKLANAFKGDIFVMDEERGVARVLLETSDGLLTIDVAAYRGDKLADDILGRDFTVNAMAVDLLGDLQLLIDPLNGEIDATQKVIRRCSSDSIADDPIRALRAIRQSTQLKFRIEPETIADMRAYGSQLVNTSSERIRDEFFKILALNKSPKALKVMHALGFLEQVVPSIRSLQSKSLPEPHVFDGWKQAVETVENIVGVMDTISYRRTDSTAASFAYGMLAMQLDRFRTELNERLNIMYPEERSHRALMVLASLIHRVGEPVKTAMVLADDLRLSNAEKKRLKVVIEHYEISKHIDYESPLDVHRFWFPIGEDGVDAILLGLADYLATYGNELNQDVWLIQIERALMLIFAFYEQHDTLISPSPLLNGSELMEALNLEGGRIVGDILTHLREAQVVGDVATVDDALAKAHQYLEDKT